MEKKYLVSEDKFSGQVVIICKTYEREVNVYVPTEQEILANQYLYRELPEQLENKTFYEVSAYYHYEEVNSRKRNCIFRQVTNNKDEANKLFKEALLFTR